LQVNVEKMSKSLGNFFTIREVLAMAPAEAIRFALIRTHYRSVADFSEAAMTEAKRELDRFYRAIEKSSSYWSAKASIISKCWKRSLTRSACLAARCSDRCDCRWSRLQRRACRRHRSGASRCGSLRRHSSCTHRRCLRHRARPRDSRDKPSVRHKRGRAS